MATDLPCQLWDQPSLRQRFGCDTMQGLQLTTGPIALPWNTEVPLNGPDAENWKFSVYRYLWRSPPRSSFPDVCVGTTNGECEHFSWFYINICYVLFHCMHFMWLFVYICLLAAFEIKTDLTPQVAIWTRSRKRSDSTLFVGWLLYTWHCEVTFHWLLSIVHWVM